MAAAAALRVVGRAHACRIALDVSDGSGRLTARRAQVFESETYGRVLVLDGCIQLTQRDEFSYQARARVRVPARSSLVTALRCRK